MSASFSLKRLGMVVATLGAGQVVLLTMVPLLSELCGLSIASIGSIVALGTLCFMAAGPLWGEISDRHGRKPVVMAGLSGALLAQLLFVGLLLALAAGWLETATGLILLGLSRVIYGLFAAGIYPACQAWAVENAAPHRRLATLSSMSAATNLGRVLGPILALPALGAGMLIASSTGVTGLLPLVWLVILPLTGILLVRSMANTGNRAAPEEAAAPASVMLNRTLCALLFSALLGATAIGQLQVMLGPVLDDFYGLTSVQASTGTALLLLMVAMHSVAMQLLVVRRLQAPRVSLALGAVLFLVGTVMLWATLGHYLALAGLLVFVSGIAFLIPGYSTLVSERGGDRRGGRVFGLLTLMHTAGHTLGFAVGGWAYTYLHDYPLLGLVVAVVMLAVTVMLALFRPARATRSVAAVTDSV